MTFHHHISTSPSVSASNSTTHLLHEQPIGKDYASAFGVLVDTYGFGAPHGASCAPPPSPVNTLHSHSRPFYSSSSSSSRSSKETCPSLYTRLFTSLLRNRANSSASDFDSNCNSDSAPNTCTPTPTRKLSLTNRLRRSAPNLRSFIPNNNSATARKAKTQCNSDDSDGDEDEDDEDDENEDEDEVQRAKNYEAAFIALQLEHGFIIGSSISAHACRHY